MSVNERQRLELYGRLEETLGREHAEVLMEYLPPVGWGDVARRHDLLLLRSDVDTAIAGVRTEMAEVRTEMADVRTEMADVRTEMADVRGEMSAFRAEVASAIGDLRIEVHQQFNRQLVWLVGTILGCVGAVLGLIAYVS